MKSQTKQIKLDWSKLFGFNQIKSDQPNAKTKSAGVVLGAKLGGKGGVKPT